MSAVTLVELQPRRPADGTSVTLRLCHNARERANFLGQQWLPLVAALPTFESVLGFDGQRFGAGATPVVGELEIALDDTIADWAGLIWKGATVTLRRAAWTAAGDDPADGSFQTVWQGRVDGAAANGAGLRLTMLDPGDVLRRPVITRLYGSSGIAVLDAAAAAQQRGNPVPMGWGRLESVPCVLLDPVDLIYLVVGQPATSVSAFYDGGAAFTLGVSRASLAALRATAPAAGRVDYCLNDSGLTLARPWTKPAYPLTADLFVGDARPAEIANAIVTSRSSLSFVAGSVTAFNAAQGSDCGLYLDDQTTIAEALDRIFAGLGAWWKLTSAGQINVRQFGYAGSALRSFGSWERGRPSRSRVVMPTRRRTLGYKPNWRVHNEGEIARSLLLTGSEVTYADGTTLEALKPAQAGATQGAPIGTVVGAYPDASQVAPAILLASTTATWASVTGTGRPADGATVGDNAVVDPAGQSGWTGGSPQGPYFAGLNPPRSVGRRISAGQSINWESGRLYSCRPGVQLFLRQAFYGYPGTDGALLLGVNWRNAAGSILSSAFVGNGSTLGAWTYQEGALTPPANAVSFDVVTSCTSTVGTGWETTDYSVGRQQPGATVGAPSGTPVGAYSDASQLAPAVLLASTTADWSGSWANAPRTKLGTVEAGATNSDNLVRNASLATDTEGWGISAGVTRVPGSAVSSDPAPGYFQFDGVASRNVTTVNPAPTAGLRRLFVSAWTYRVAGATNVDGFGMNFLWRKADAATNASPASTFVDLWPAAAGVWVRIDTFVDVPADAAVFFIQLFAGNRVQVANMAGIRVSYVQAEATRNLPRGTWTSGVAYVVGDTVTLGGSSYVCILAHTSSGGNTPPNATFWQLLAQQGLTGVSAPPVASLASGSGQLDPVRLTNGQTVTVAAELFLNAGGSAGACTLQVQISEAGLGSWTTMTGGTASQNLPTTEPVELAVTGATFTNTSGTPRLYDIRAVSVRNGRTVNGPVSGMRVI